MGFFKALGSLVNRNAWVEQYVENLEGFSRGAAIEFPTHPRCAHLAIAWAKQFTVPFCPVPQMYNSVGIARDFASFFSCLDRSSDIEALALHALLEANYDKVCERARRGLGGVEISDFIGQRFGARYVSLTHDLFQALRNENYSELEQKFDKKNPNGSRFLAFANSDKLVIQKLPDSHEPVKQSDFVFWEGGMTYTFGVRISAWSVDRRQELTKWW